MKPQPIFDTQNGTVQPKEKQKEQVMRIRNRLSLLIRKNIDPIRSLAVDLTSQYCKVLLCCPSRYVSWIVKVWLRSILAIRDEALVLFNGKSDRKYHHQEHGLYWHKRTEHGNDRVSACCQDGLVEEIRRYALRSKHDNDVRICCSIFVSVC